MCGIVGIVESDLSRPVRPEDLARMVEQLHHRGPDDEGSITMSGVGLGMRRLSIVDLAGGQQPFSNETDSIQLVANGEIYNFPELRKELEGHGHRFRSRSDIEVLVHAYEQWGEAFLTRLRGMFALALWDAQTRTLLAARDRAGEKPLYWTLTPRGLLLASEVKALLVRPEVTRELDLEAVDQFLTYEYVMAPRTILKGVHKLPPGHYLIYRNGEVSVHRYWDAAAIRVREWNDDDAAEALREALRRATVSQMMADVPLGAFLSGGIDSSGIVAFMSQASMQPVNSFSIGFDNGTYNELPYAREVAELFKTNHRERMVAPDLQELFEKLIVHLDEPFADVSLFPTYMVSQLAREHVTVALSGDGGDELFGGYDAYQAQEMASRLAWAGDALLPAAAAVAAVLPPTEKKKGVVNKFKRFTLGATQAPADLGHYRWMVYLGARAKGRLYGPAMQDALTRSDVYQPVRAALARYGHNDLLNRQLYTDLSLYLADDILVKVDRMSMATSLETRAPFLDVDVMELAFSMGGRLKIRDGERKWVLKRALRGVLPERILMRKKEGFSIPMKNWLRRELEPLMRALLSPERVATRGLFEPAEVSRLIDDHVAGRENHAHTLFPLMVFERWCEAHLR
ncbi:MAG TPA: asparagine synthase (glutamine-hydrolyzing) [Vicinamibacterales bacterium]|nr:asparagine synthase (glutamine-hydrolyzing) [Vicinamibacterales bacterium]